MPRGLANVSDALRRAIGKMGGEASHVKRGLQTASESTRQRVASAGGRAKARKKR